MLLEAAVATGFGAATTWPERCRPSPRQTRFRPREKELEGAAAKVREGKLDEALRLIKEKAAKHPEWPPSQLILARMLFNANQAVPGRRALEQAATEAPDNPEIYLTFGSLALGEGRLSDARLNFDKVQAIAAVRQVECRENKVHQPRGARGPGHCGGSTRRLEDGPRAIERAGSRSIPRTARFGSGLGQALFRLGKTDEAFAALTQAVKDAPTLEPAAVWMALLYSQKGDFKKAEDWFDKREEGRAQERAGSARPRDMAVGPGAGPPMHAPRSNEAAKLDPALKEAQRVRGLVAWHLRDLADRRSDPRAAASRLHRPIPSSPICWL